MKFSQYEESKTANKLLEMIGRGKVSIAAAHELASTVVA